MRITANASEVAAVKRMGNRLFQLLEPETTLDSKQKIFSDAALMQMIIPLFFEQLLAMTVGIADTFMIKQCRLL